LDESGKIIAVVGGYPKRVSAKELTGWAEKQAEIIVDSFLADGAPADLLRLEQAIAYALRRAYERGHRLQPASRRLLGLRPGRTKKS